MVRTLPDLPYGRLPLLSNIFYGWVYLTTIGPYNRGMLFWPLMLVNGVLWTLTYVLMIERGRKDETYGMPLAALCANLSWEFIFVFVFPHGAVQRTVNAVWLALDVVILSQVLRFGHKEFPAVPVWAFRALLLCGLVLGFGAVFSVTVEF